jgi:hypothetical protein
MFATTIPAWRMSHPLNSPRFQPVRAVTVHLIVRSLFMRVRHCQRWIDLVDQRPRRREALHRLPIRRRRDTPVGPVLSHRDPPPPVDLTHEEQTMPPALRKQHDKALPVQRMERMSDHQ